MPTALPYVISDMTAFLRTEEGIKHVLNDPLGFTPGASQSNRYLVYRMLHAMYARQTADEQSFLDTLHSNGVGFSALDAQFLSDVAQKTVTDWSLTFTEARAKAVAKCLKRYVGQLVSIARGEAAAISQKQEQKTIPEIVTASSEVIALRPKREKRPGIIKHRKVSTIVKKYQVQTVEKLITTSNDDYYFLISFPEAEIASIEVALKSIPECAYWSRTPIDNKVTTIQPEDSAAVPDVSWKQIWRVRKTEETLKLVAAFAKKFKFDAVGDILMQAQLSTSEAKDLEKMSYAKSTSLLKLPKLSKGCKPYPFQVAGTAYALRTKKCFIADEMGLGKTIQALLTMRMSKRWPWLVIVPAVAKINWYRETKKWLGRGFSVGIAGNNQLTPLHRSAIHKPYTEAEKKKLLRSGKKWLTEHQVVIVNYDRVIKYAEYLKQIKWTGVVFDESHYCKSNSMRTRACKDLLLHLDPEYILALSGTPVMNNPKELIRQLQLLGRINDFGGPVHFLNRYCSVTGVDMSKLPKLPKLDENGSLTAISDVDQDLRDTMVRKMYENQITLNKELRSLCFVRREKEDVLESLPDKTRTTVMLDITNRKEYERIERDVIGFLMDRISKDEKFLSKIAKLSKEDQVRAIKDRRNEVGYRSARAEALVKIEMCKQAAAIGKLDAAQEWMENVINNGEKLVMFATHNNILDELEARFPKGSVSLRGGMSDEHKQETQDKFQTDKKVRLFIGSLRAAGVAITLTASSTPAFMELGWNPAIHDQAEDRTHRIGQKNAVNAYYLIAKGTIEEKIARLIERKRNIVDATSFGDPVSKAAVQGTILGDLISELTNKRSLD